MKKAVTLMLGEMTFIVEGNDPSELRKNAKKAMIKAFEENIFPHITFSFDDANSLTLASAYPGTIIKTAKGELGIITSIGKKNISATLTGHRDVSGPPQAFMPSDESFESVRSRRQDNGFSSTEWTEGDSGYAKIGGEVLPVVFGKKKGSKYNIYIINEKGRCATITEAQLKAVNEEIFK